MSTSNIPIYYKNHLVGSMTLGEFMNQPRYDGRSVMDLMSLPKDELIHIFVAVHGVGTWNAERIPAERISKSKFIWAIIYSYWLAQGARTWEKDALDVIRDVYLSK